MHVSLRRYRFIDFSVNFRSFYNENVFLRTSVHQPLGIIFVYCQFDVAVIIMIEIPLKYLI